MNPIILKNSALQLEFAPDTGVLTGFRVNETNWSILDRPELGLSFKLLVPSGRRRNNPVDGERQRLSSHAFSPDGKTLTLVWDGVDSLHAGRLDIRVEVAVRLEGGKAVWSCTLVNRGNLVIESAYVPYFGDLRPAPGAERMVMTHGGYNDLAGREIWPRLTQTRGYYGTDYPTTNNAWHTGNMPMAPYASIEAGDRGLYFSYESQSWDFVGLLAEAHPGYSRSIDQSLPRGDRIGQHPVSLRLALVHFPFVRPGETRRLQPVCLQAYRGDWHVAADLFKASPWRLPTAKPPAWINEPHSWLQIHVNSPEGEARIRYRDLVPLAAEMARHGIQGFQITGWNLGGQDQNNPSHDTDPLLGTWEELREAIRQIQALGVKVILFAKFTWADRATERFRKELHRLAVTDPYGDYYMHMGYQYQTPMQVFDLNTKRLIPMCMLTEDYLKVCETEFKKILDLGADGFLFDECLHHGPAGFCFHPDHAHPLGANIFANDNYLIERFRRLSDPVRPDFCYAGEAIYDREFAVYHFSYFRSENLSHKPWFRYLRPDAALSTAVTGFDDREMIAQCLLYKYIISYEPFNFKGRPEDYPLTLEYGKKMDALRAELRRWFWDGECRDTLGATVTNAEGKPHHPYTVFAPRDGGAPGVAIANYSPDKEAVLSLKIEGQDAAKYKYRLIDDPTWKSAAGGVRIPARGAVVVVEGEEPRR